MGSIEKSLEMGVSKRVWAKINEAQEELEEAEPQEDKIIPSLMTYLSKMEEVFRKKGKLSKTDSLKLLEDLSIKETETLQKDLAVFLEQNELKKQQDQMDIEALTAQIERLQKELRGKQLELEVTETAATISNKITESVEVAIKTKKKDLKMRKKGRVGKILRRLKNED